MSDYNAAFASPAQSILVGEYARGKAKPGPFGTPLPISGGFAYIYQLAFPSGERKAVRCFIDDDAGRFRQTALVIKRLEKLKESASPAAPYFVDTRWYEPFITAGGRDVPALTMDWAEGETLGSWLEGRHGDRAALTALRSRLAAMAADLAAAGLAHGDLQTGNVVVGSGGDPVLVDYDGVRFYDDARPLSEQGHPNFQHPDRGTRLSPQALDRFSVIAMDLGLAAFIERPDFFDRFSTGENILFVADDFADPASSPAFIALSGVPSLSRAAGIFSEICVGSPEDVPTLADFAALCAGTGRVSLTKTSTSGVSRPGVMPSTAPDSGSIGQVTPRTHIGAWEVLPAVGYRQLLARVGRRVEVIGKVTDTYRGITIHGKPYVFVNFTDWRGHFGSREIFKVTFWSEGLENVRAEPGPHWVGKWISVTGLVDEPYVNERFGTTQISITVLEGNQLRFIDEEEARRRLGSPSPVHLGKDNSTIAAAMSAPATTTTKASNAELLASLDPPAAAFPTGTRSTQSSPPKPKIQQFPPSGYKYQAPPKEKSSHIGWWILGAFAAFIFYLVTR